MIGYAKLQDKLVLPIQIFSHRSHMIPGSLTVIFSRSNIGNASAIQLWLWTVILTFTNAYEDGDSFSAVKIPGRNDLAHRVLCAGLCLRKSPEKGSTHSFAHLSSPLPTSQCALYYCTFNIYNCLCYSREEWPSTLSTLCRTLLVAIPRKQGQLHQLTHLLICCPLLSPHTL